MQTRELRLPGSPENCSKMKKLIFALVFFPLFISAQTPQSPVVFEASAGLNYSKLYYEGVDFERVVHPYLGANANLILSQRFGLKASALYSMWSSQSVSPHFWHRNTYAVLKFQPQYLVADFFSLNFGVSASLLMNSRKLTLDGSTGSGRKSEPLSGYGSEYHPVAGFDLQLGDRLVLGMNYFIPLEKTASRNFQIGLQIPLGVSSRQDASERVLNKHMAKEHILDMKHGSLLVRLPVYESKINALRSTGHHEEAEKTEEARDIANNEIIAAFKEHFDFCQVFFFYNTHISDIRRKEYNGILFDFDREIIDPQEHDLDRVKVFIAEFSILPGDTTKRFADHEMRVNPDGSGWERRTYYHTQPDFGFDALVIMDHQLNPLSKPFPYYTRLMGKSLQDHPEQALFLAPILLFQQYSYDAAVRKMNEQLTRFFNKSSRK